MEKAFVGPFVGGLMIAVVGAIIGITAESGRGETDIIEVVQWGLLPGATAGFVVGAIVGAAVGFAADHVHANRN